MSYIDQFEYQLTDRAVVTSTGVKAALAAGINPFVIRRVGFLITTAMTVQSLILRVEKSTAGGAFAALPTTVTITIPTTATVGQVYWVDVSAIAGNITIKPGDMVGFDVTQAPTAGAGSIILVLDPSFDAPLNETQTVKVTS